MHSQRKNDVSRANGREILFRVKLDDKVLLEREVNVISLRQFLDGCANILAINLKPLGRVITSPTLRSMDGMFAFLPFTRK